MAECNEFVTNLQNLYFLFVLKILGESLENTETTLSHLIFIKIFLELSLYEQAMHSFYRMNVVRV
jgi:hypothetical protein